MRKEAFSDERIRAVKREAMSQGCWKYDRYEKDIILYGVVMEESFAKSRTVDRCHLACAEQFGFQRKRAFVDNVTYRSISIVSLFFFVYIYRNIHTHTYLNTCILINMCRRIRVTLDLWLSNKPQYSLFVSSEQDGRHEFPCQCEARAGFSVGFDGS